MNNADLSVEFDRNLEMQFSFSEDLLNVPRRPLDFFFGCDLSKIVGVDSDKEYYYAL